jgi:hypothetical protein
MPFQPLTNYQNYNHVLFAGASFVHPGNGNVYFCACEQVGGVHQDLSVYRMIAQTGAIELVKRYHGGASDSPSQITMGSAVIAQGGAMFVATSLVIPDVPKVTVTGWQGSWIREPNIDAPWSLASGGQPGPQGPVGPQGPQGVPGPAGSGGGLSPEDAELLDWVRAYRAVLHQA